MNGIGITSPPPISPFSLPAAPCGWPAITHFFGSAQGPATQRMMECVCADGFCDETMRDRDWSGYGELLARGAEAIDAFEADPTARVAIITGAG